MFTAPFLKNVSCPYLGQVIWEASRTEINGVIVNVPAIYRCQKYGWDCTILVKIDGNHFCKECEHNPRS